MYHNLMKEIAKANIKISKLAIRIGVTEKTLRNKLGGKTEFNWPEVLQIRNIVAPQAKLEELFQNEEDENSKQVFLLYCTLHVNRCQYEK